MMKKKNSQSAVSQPTADTAEAPDMITTPVWTTRDAHAAFHPEIALLRRNYCSVY